MIQSKQVEKISCPSCGSISFIKKGVRKNKFKTVQLFLCKDCNKRFTNDKFKNKTYTIAETVKALSLYNRGFTIEEVAKKIRIPRSTIAKWISEYRQLFNLIKFSKEVQKFSKSDKLIEGHKFIHKLIYLYLQHNYKIERSIKIKEPKLYSYLQKARKGEINKNIFFNSDARASKIKLNILHALTVTQSYNNACKLASIAIELVNDNRNRHWAVEKIMLENDTSTIASEVPVYLQLSKSTIPWVKQIKSSNDYITGHIDLLQYRNNKLYILDYKPNAEKEKPIGQLFIYACCLSKSTGIPFSKMRLAWFDDKIYFEVEVMDVYKEVMRNWKKDSNSRYRKATNIRYKKDSNTGNE